MISKAVTFSLLTIPAVLSLSLPALAADDDVDVDVRVRSGDRGLSDVRANAPSLRFGAKGQKAVSSDAGLSISTTSVSGVDGSTTNLILRPAVDWFFTDSISFGGFVGVEYTSAPGGSSTIMSLGPRIGYDLPLTARLSVWPKIGFSLANTSVDNDGIDGIGDEEETNTSVQLNLFVPVMFHPVQHFFLGFGPALDQDLSGDSKATTIAARLTIGGWI